MHCSGRRLREVFLLRSTLFNCLLLTAYFFAMLYALCAYAIEPPSTERI